MLTILSTIPFGIYSRKTILALFFYFMLCHHPINCKHWGANDSVNKVSQANPAASICCVTLQHTFGPQAGQRLNIYEPDFPHLIRCCTCFLSEKRSQVINERQMFLCRKYWLQIGKILVIVNDRKINKVRGFFYIKKYICTYHSEVLFILLEGNTLDFFKTYN